MRAARRVCIVGFAGGLDHVPWKQAGWELWGFNQMYRALWPSAQLPFTRWFELHTPDYFGRTARGESSADTWLRIAAELNLLMGVRPSAAGAREAGLGRMDRLWPMIQRDLDRGVWRRVPVYLPRRNRLVPKARIYPRPAVEALTPHGAYHAGSFDWLVALAILDGFRHIRITGVDFALGGEPISARPCLEYWLGVAEGRGITTEVIGGDVFRIFHLARHDRPYGFAPFQLVEDQR